MCSWPKCSNNNICEERKFLRLSNNEAEKAVRWKISSKRQILINFDLSDKYKGICERVVC